MKERLARWLNSIKDWFLSQSIIKNIKEHTAIAVALTVMLLFHKLVVIVDPTAGSYDAGVLQIIVMTILQIVIYQWCTWRIIVAIWRVFADYGKKQFTEDFKLLQPWQKIKAFLYLYSFYLLVFAILSRTVS